LKNNDITKTDNDQLKSFTEWDNAIEDAKKGIKRLEGAIETYKEMKRIGEPWPGSAR
jgi:hypothetical protein